MKDSTIWLMTIIALAIFTLIVYAAFKLHLLLLLGAFIVALLAIAIWLIRNNIK